MAVLGFGICPLSPYDEGMASFFSANYFWAYPLFGVFIGIFAGLTGLGGGAVLVPTLVLAFAKSQKVAQGTSLAMIMSPAAVPAIYKYHSSGYVDWRMVLYVAPFMLVGSYIGALFADKLNQGVLKAIIALVLTYVASYMIFGTAAKANGNYGRAVILSFVPVVVLFGLGFASGSFTKVAKAAPVEKTGSTAPASEAMETPAP